MRKAVHDCKTLIPGASLIVLLAGTLILTLTALSSSPSPTAPGAPVAGYATTWVGNSFGYGGYADGNPVGIFVQPQATDLTVTPNGSVIVANNYDEGHRYFGMYRNGKPIASVGFNCIGGPTHLLGGFAVTNNGTYIYAAVYDDNKNLRGGPHNWIQRYSMNETPSTFSGASGSCSNQITVDSGATGPIFGLSASATELYVADSAANAIKVYDANTMAFKRQFSFANPRRITYDPNTSTLWISQGGSDRSFAGNVYHHDLNGKRLSGTITNVTAPTALAIQPGTKRLWVADNGRDQQFKIYDGNGKEVGTFGVRGGVYSDTPGVIAPNKFWYPFGIGFDSSGNVYTVGANVNGGWSLNDLRAFNSSGTELWALQGFGYVKTAAPDPATDGQDVYMTNVHYKMNYNNLTTGAGGGGKEQSWYGVTIDPFLYPNDPRLSLSLPVVSGIRSIGGHRYMLITELYAYSPVLYRFNGEIAVPMAMIGAGGFGSWPMAPSGTWLWQDSDGDGNPQSGEFSSFTSNVGPSAQEDWFLDSKGNLWYVQQNPNGISELPMRGIDSHGHLTYNTTVSTYGVPAPFNLLRKLRYDAANDVMYISGYTSSLRFHNNEPYNTYSAGTVLARYNNWSDGNRTPAWTINLPHDPSAGVTIKPWTVAGGKLFAGLFETQHTGSGFIYNGDRVTHNIYVYDASTGAYLGEMMPGIEANHFMGWLDCDQVLNAIQRTNGEYVVFEEDEIGGRVIVLRGMLNNFLQY